MLYHIVLIVLSSFINTTAGWVNLLLLSSSGPIKIPVGAWYVLCGDRCGITAQSSS